MSDFSTVLMREKIIIVFDDVDTDSLSEPVIIRSNRIYIKLDYNGVVEKVVIRGQNTGDTLRMASIVMDDHYRRGKLSSSRMVLWDDLWEKTVSNYGRKYNADKNWVAVYIDGRVAYQTKASPFVNIVEQCALKTLDHYDETMGVMKTAMEQVGKTVQIEHSVNVAATFIDTGDLTRVGIMKRSKDRNHTFTFTVKGGNVRTGRILRSFMTAAAFLEVLDVAMFITDTQDSLITDEVDTTSDKSKRANAAARRRTELVHIISGFERSYDVHYRPEKPNFF